MLEESFMPLQTLRYKTLKKSDNQQDKLWKMTVLVEDICLSLKKRDFLDRIDHSEAQKSCRLSAFPPRLTSEHIHAHGSDADMVINIVLVNLWMQEIQGW